MPGNSRPEELVLGTRVHKMPKTVGLRSASAPAGAHLSYFGGRVVSNMQVVQVLWGTGVYLSNVTSTASPSMATFYQDVLNSAYVDWLDGEYNTVSNAFGGAQTNQHIGRGSFLSQVTITPASSATTISDATIQAELARQLGLGTLPAPTQDAAGNNNTYYAVFFPHGKTITQGGSSSCVGGGFCAYHGTIASAGGHEIYYGVHPDMQSGSGCDTGCGNAATPFGNYTSVASHEMIETVTDPEVGLATVVGPPLAWYDNTNGEIGDICNAQQGSIAGYVVQQEFSNSQNNCIVSGPVSTPNDFTISASPASVSVAQGASGTSSISTAIASGAAETISLTASGAPAGVTATLSPASVSTGGSSTLTLAVGAAVAAGTYPITVTGTAPSATHSTSVSLTVTAAPPPPPNDFSIAASPASVSVAQGASGTSSISTALVSGVAETISLSASGAPAGVTATLSPASVSTGQSATLTLAATSAAAAGTYPITVTGTAASATHSTSVSLTITGGGVGGGIVNGGFETGTLSGWTRSGAAESVVSSGCHGGSFCARLGSTRATDGTSNLAQTFTAPAGSSQLSLWYANSCLGNVNREWVTVRLRDNTTRVTTTVVPRTCAASFTWQNATAAVQAGHSYTLTLSNRDDGRRSDPTYTLFDDIGLN